MKIEDFNNCVIDEIWKLYYLIYEKLEEIFKKCKPLTRKNNGEKREINSSGVTETLVTKIMLGSYGCIVAYDKFIKNKLVELKITKNIKNEKNFKKSMEQIIKLISNLKIEKDEYYQIMKRFDISVFGLKNKKN